LQDFIREQRQEYDPERYQRTYRRDWHETDQQLQQSDLNSPRPATTERTNRGGYTSSRPSANQNRPWTLSTKADKVATGRRGYSDRETRYTSRPSGPSRPNYASSTTNSGRYEAGMSFNRTQEISTQQYDQQRNSSSSSTSQWKSPFSNNGGGYNNRAYG
ncbi:hypothetical protein HDU76_012231, partial [Blyttiomyces sp. JEL0837]